MLEIPSFVTTYSALCFVIIENIDQYLPQIPEFCHKNVYLDPCLESKPIIVEPSTHEILNCLNILYDTIENFLFYVEEILKFFWKIHVTPDDLYICLNTTNQRPCIDTINSIFREIFPRIEHGLISDKPCLSFLFANPWNLKVNSLWMYINNWKSADVLKCILDTRSFFFYKRCRLIFSIVDITKPLRYSITDSTKATADKSECTIPSISNSIARSF